MHAAIDAFVIIDFRFAPSEVFNSRRAWCTKGIVLTKYVAVMELDLTDRGFGDRIQNISAGTSKAHNMNAVELEFLRYCANPSASRCCVHVHEGRCLIRVLNYPERPGCDG